MNFLSKTFLNMRIVDEIEEGPAESEQFGLDAREEEFSHHTG